MEDFRHRFVKTAGLIDAGIEHDLHIGAQVYISVAGKPLADWAVGLAREGVQMTPATIMPWLSSGKPVAAVAVARLLEAGLLQLDDRVGKYIPEFAVKGKEPITLAHLLTHTGGFRMADYSSEMPWDQIIAHICQTPLEPRWIPGQTAGYHPETSWYILGELIRRVDPAHRSYSTFVRDEIFQPLGMDDCWFAMDPQVCRDDRARLGSMRVRTPLEKRTIDLTYPSHCTFCSPGAGGRGPARQMGLFYETLLSAGRAATGQQLLSPSTIQKFTAPERIGLYDLTFKHIVDWGYGFIVNSARYGEESVPYGFGPHASPETFGHGGKQSSVGLADPKNQIVIVVIFNGMPGEAAHHQRMREVLKSIFEELSEVH
jgi:CubicO group peptidase (beta-lactamase class C family)